MSGRSSGEPLGFAMLSLRSMPSAEHSAAFSRRNSLSRIPSLSMPKSARKTYESSKPERPFLTMLPAKRAMMSSGRRARGVEVMHQCAK